MIGLSVRSILKTESLDCFNEDFDSLLLSHEEHRRSQQFDQQRLSIISTSSNHDLQNSSSLFQRKKDKDNSNKKKKKKTRQPKQQQRKFRENEELDDVESRLQTLQNVLKYLPEERTQAMHDDKDNAVPDDDDFEAVCSGFLVVVGDNISEATRFYAELLNNVLYLRREPNGKVKQVITISFIQSTALGQDQESDEKNHNDKQKEAQKEKIDAGKYVDLFLAHLESQSANHSFKLFSPTGIYVLSASCFRDKQRFSKCIEAELLKLFDNETWIAKIEASEQLKPVERAQFEIQIEQHEQILSSLTLTGLANNVGLLGSAHKEKSGVMRILKHTHSHSYKYVSSSKKHNKWEDHFFVLTHATLYYFQHDPDKEVSQSSMPKSFIPLKYASIELDVERIKSDRFVFSIATPLRTVFLRCRHPIALAEWVSSLYRAQRKALAKKTLADAHNHTNSSNNDGIQKDSKHVLQEIRVIRSKVATLHNLLREKTGIKIFEEFLQSTQSSSLLRCWLAILHWKHNMSASNQVKRPTLLAKLNDGKHNAADQLPLEDQEEKKAADATEDEEDADGGGGMDEDAFASAQKEAQILFEQYINDTQQNSATNIWKALDNDDYDSELILECKRRVYETKSSGNLLAPSATAATGSLSDVVLKIVECFDEVLDILDDTLNFEFEQNFVKTKPYTALKKKYDADDKFLPLPLDREIEDFPENVFIVLKCMNKDLSTKEIKLSTKQTVATIGRDCSNMIVLDDAHVSRSHARIEYDQHSAHFTDFGSHHGSFLNGNRVLHERLADGDTLKLGGCDVLFNVKTKKNFMNKMFGK